MIQKIHHRERGRPGSAVRYVCDGAESRRIDRRRSSGRAEVTVKSTRRVALVSTGAGSVRVTIPEYVPAARFRGSTSRVTMVAPTPCLGLASSHPVESEATATEKAVPELCTVVQPAERQPRCPLFIRREYTRSD